MIGGVQYYVEEAGDDQHQRRSGAGRHSSRSGGRPRCPPADIYDVLVGRRAARRPAGRGVPVHRRAASTAPSTPSVGGGYLHADDRRHRRRSSRTAGWAGCCATSAVEAGKVDDLRAQARGPRRPAARRAAGPGAARHPRACEAKDDARAIEVFKALGERIQKDSLAGDQRPRHGRAAAGARRPEVRRPASRPFIEKAAENYATGNNIAAGGRAAVQAGRATTWHARTRRRPGPSSRPSRRSARRSAAASTTSTCRWPGST